MDRLQEIKYREMREVLNHLPLMGISVPEIAETVHLSISTIYSYRRGYLPTETKYRMIMSKLRTKYPFEVASAIEIIKKEDEVLGVN